MSSLIYLGSQVRVRVYFRVDVDTSDSDDVGELTDPDSVVVQILDGDDTVLDTVTAERESLGTYSYLWVPDAIGDFSIKFVGAYSDGTESTIVEEFTVAESTTDLQTDVLGEDHVYVFASDFTPMFVEPEEVHALFPTAGLAEVAEWIHYYSLEAQNFLDDPNVPTFAVTEYVKAAAACALSRMYDPSGNEEQFMLGDLQVTNRNDAKSSLSRGNATTWCEIAAVLRDELRRGRTNIKAVVPGSRLERKIPERLLKRVD